MWCDLKLTTVQTIEMPNQFSSQRLVEAHLGVGSGFLLEFVVASYPPSSSLFRNTSLALAKSYHGPLTRYAKLRVAHAPGTCSPPPISKESASWRPRHASRHVRDARAVRHVGMANLRWRGKRSRHSRRMRNPQFYVSDKRPIENTGEWNIEVQKEVMV